MMRCVDVRVKSEIYQLIKLIQTTLRDLTGGPLSIDTQKCPEQIAALVKQLQIVF